MRRASSMGGRRVPRIAVGTRINGGAGIPACRESVSGGIPAPSRFESARRRRVRLRTRRLEADKNVCPTPNTARSQWDGAMTFGRDRVAVALDSGTLDGGCGMGGIMGPGAVDSEQGQQSRQDEQHQRKLGGKAGDNG